MKKFFILMRGSQESFTSLSEADQLKVIREYSDWAKKLDEQSLLIDGNGFYSISCKLEKYNDQLIKTENPYQNSKEQLSGFYMIQAEDYDQAVKIAEDCPALRFNESIEVVEMGH